MKIRILWALGGLLLILAGGATIFYLRWTPVASGAPDPIAAASDPMSQAAIQVRDYASTQSRDGPSTQARDGPPPPLIARLDQLYAELCDPATGEPGAPPSAAGLRNVTSVLRDASQDDPHNAALHRLLGEYLLAGGMNLAAITELRAAADMGESPVKFAVPLAFALSRADRLEDLLALPVPPGSTPHQVAVLNLVKAHAEVMLGQPPKAEVALQHALDAEPRNLGVIEQLGLQSLRQHQPATSRRWLAQATAIDPEAASTLRLRGEYAFATRDFADSAVAYRKLMGTRVATRDEMVAPGLGLARAQIYQGDLKSAAVALDRAGLPADDPHLGYYRALLAFRSGDLAHASDLAEPLSNRMHAFPDLDLLIGVTKLANGYPETALHYLRRYVDAVPDNSVAHGLLDEADQRVSGTDPGDVIAPERLAAAFGFAEAKVDVAPK